MRRHPERDGRFENPRTSLGLSRYARFCTAISQARFINSGYERVVVRIFQGQQVVSNRIVGEATQLIIESNKAVLIRSLATGERYRVYQDGNVTTRVHGQDDGINCQNSV